MGVFENKVAVVTGAGLGIGRATALKLASEGAKVIVVDVNEQAGQQTATDTSGLFVAADVSSATDAMRVAELAMSNFGRIDVLVNNAGIQRYGSVVDTPEEVWDLVLAVNLKSVYLMSHACVPHMLAADGGAVVNVASVQGLSTQQSVAAYAASKGGVITLTKSMSNDLAPKVRVNAICPGAVQTPMLQGSDALRAGVPSAPQPSEEPSNVPIANPSQIADVIAYLASPAASFVTGSIVVADGGLTAHLPEV